MPEGDILHDTAGDCSYEELPTARLAGRECAKLAFHGPFQISRSKPSYVHYRIVIIIRAQKARFPHLF